MANKQYFFLELDFLFTVWFKVVLTLTYALNTIMTVDLQIPENIIEYVKLSLVSLSQ